MHQEQRLITQDRPTRPMHLRAAYICSDRGVPVFGSKGCSLHIQEVSQALTQSQIMVSLFAASTGGSCPSTLKDVALHRIKHAHLNDRAEREQSDIEDNHATIKKLHLHGPFNLVYERYSLWSHAGMTYARMHNIPAILEVNAPLVEEQQRYRGLIDRDSAIKVSRRCFADATHILAVSAQVADYLSGFAETKDKVHVLPNGVNTERFSAVCSIRSSLARPFTIGFVGTLKPWHGVDILINCFAQLHSRYKEINLLIVGDGPEYHTLQQQIIDLGLERAIHMTGAVAPSLIPKYYTMMDVGVAPYPDSISFYFSPLKVFEYMAAGLPVVASDIGQISEVVQHEENGLLYRPSEPKQLYSALESLYLQPDKTRLLGQRGREIAVTQHSWQQRVNELLQITGLKQGETIHG